MCILGRFFLVTSVSFTPPVGFLLFLSPLVKFVDGEWVLDEPRFVPATFLDVTALECQLPLVDRQTPAGVDVKTAPNRPLARWQIKVSPRSTLVELM